MAKLTDNQLGAICQEEIALSRTYAGNIVQQDRAEAQRLYDGGLLGNEVEGRSTYVSTDLTDMVHATIAQLQPGYAGDSLCEFEAMGDDDAEQAKAESAAVNAQFVERNQGFYQIESAFMDALLFANGSIYVWIEAKVTKDIQRYEGLEGEQKRFLERQEGYKLLEEEEGECTFEITSEKQFLYIERVNASDVYVDPNQDRLTYEKTSWFSIRRRMTRSDLLELGIPNSKVKHLEAHGLDREIDQIDRYISGVQNPSDAATRDRDIIEIFECWLRITDDGKSGISHMERVLYCDDSSVVVLREPADFIPVATGTGFIYPGRWYGQSLYHKLKSIIFTKSRAIRQWIDGNELALNPRKYVNEDFVNIDDLLSSRIGGIVRTTANPAEVIMSEQPMDVAASAMSMLEYMDAQRAERTGASMDVMQPEAQVMENISGVSAQVQLNSRELMASKIARTLSETLIRNTYLLIHETLRRQWKGTIPIKVNGVWSEVSPADWKVRDRVNVKVGVSPAERSKRVGALQGMLQMQLTLIQSGGAGVIADLNTVHRLLLDLGKAQGLDSIDSYWIDPESPQSKQAQQGKAQQGEQQSQEQSQVQQFMAALETRKVDIDDKKVEYDKQDDDFDNQTDRLKLLKEFEIEESKQTHAAIDSARAAAAVGTADKGSDGNTHGAY